MRRVLIVAVAVVVALGLAGCGGGSPEPSAPAEAPVVDPGAAANASVQASDTASQGEVFYPFPITETTPASIRGGIDAGEPMILLFADSGQKVTDDVRKQVNAVVAETDVGLYTFDLGQYASVDSEGQIELDSEALKNDPAGQALVATARDLGIAFVPYTVIVDYQGQVVFKHAGFIDSALLERQVARAVE